VWGRAFREAAYVEVSLSKALLTAGTSSGFGIMAVSMEKLQVVVGIAPAQVFGSDVVDLRQVPTREEQPTAGTSDPVATHYRRRRQNPLRRLCMTQASNTVIPLPLKGPT